MIYFPLGRSTVERRGFAHAYETLMEPVRTILEASKDCDWDYLPDLPNVATATSKFEKSIDIKKDKCGNLVLMMGGFVQCHAADEHIYHEMFIHPAIVTFAAMNGHAPVKVFLGG